MDGRIIPIAEAGFVPGTLVVPRSVIGELQLLADGSDGDKRERARRGLDAVSQLQKIERVTVTILQDGSRASEGVDERLLTLAKKRGGLLCTIDYNLIKVAQVEKVGVLNINELAQQLRMSYLPGDKIHLALTHPGSDSHQAVGHLNDGTMVVVEHAKAQLNKNVEIEIIRSLQTAAGRMMFAKLVGGSKPIASQSSKGEAQGRRKVTPTSLARSPRNKNAAQRAVSSSGASKQISSNTTKPTSDGRRAERTTSRKTREDSFIELVNKQ